MCDNGDEWHWRICVNRAAVLEFTIELDSIFSDIFIDAERVECFFATGKIRPFDKTYCFGEAYHQRPTHTDARNSQIKTSVRNLGNHWFSFITTDSKMITRVHTPPIGGLICLTGRAFTAVSDRSGCGLETVPFDSMWWYLNPRC